MRNGCALRREIGISAALLTRGGLIAHMFRHERSPRHLRHLPRDYELAIRWLEPSFLNTIESLGRPATADGYPYGIAPLRYAEPGKAHLRAARCAGCPHVCLR